MERESDAFLARFAIGLTCQPKGPVVVLSGEHVIPPQTKVRYAEAAKLGTIPLTISGRHTREEADRAIHLAETDLTVVTSVSHGPRAFLTFVQAMKDAKRDRQLRVWMVLAPDEAWRRHGEDLKLATYQAKGDVASFSDGVDYLTWRDG